MLSHTMDARCLKKMMSMELGRSKLTNLSWSYLPWSVMFNCKAGVNCPECGCAFCSPIVNTMNSLKFCLTLKHVHVCTDKVHKFNVVSHGSSFCFRIESLTKQYQELEDEFRLALQIEANRFQEVKMLGHITSLI